MLRFERALALLRADAISLSAVALAAGYCDQPHLTAEVRALAGMTPAQLRAAVRYPNAASLAEPGADG